MFKKIVICIFWLNSIFLTGCATVSHVPLSRENSQSINTIYVNSNIKKPDHMYEFKSGYQFGLLPALVVNAADRGSISTQEFAEKNNIDIKRIVYQQWVNQIKSKSKFKLATKQSDAILATDITMYGISIPHGFTTDYVPVLALNAKLIRNNKIIWQDREQVMPLTSGMPKYKMAQILQDPKKLYAMWDKASEKIVSEMLVDMNNVKN